MEKKDNKIYPRKLVNVVDILFANLKIGHILLSGKSVHVIEYSCHPLASTMVLKPCMCSANIGDIDVAYDRD